MDFVCKLYGNTYAVHVTVALVGVATLNLALPAPPWVYDFGVARPLAQENFAFGEVPNAQF